MSDPTAILNPKRGEIWQVNFNPSKGAEIRKERPALVISSDALGILPLKLVVPITGWHPAFDGRIWIVRVEASKLNGLDKASAIDTLQTKSFDTTTAEGRFISRRGILEPDKVNEVAAAIAALVEFQ